MSDKLLLKPTEVADLIGCSKSQVYLMLARGEIPSIKVGNLLRVPRVALERLIAQKMADVSVERRWGRAMNPSRKLMPRSGRRQPNLQRYPEV